MKNRLWELAIYVSSGSNIQDRDILGQELDALGWKTRDIRDKVLAINSLSLSSFTWILHSFNKMQQVIARAHSNPNNRQANPPDLATILDTFFDKLSAELGGILKSLDAVIPLADQASTTGGRLMRELEEERRRIERVASEGGLGSGVWYRALLGIHDFKAKQLRTDLELSSRAVIDVGKLRYGMERVRSDLLAYSTHVGLFKVHSCSSLIRLGLTRVIITGRYGGITSSG